MPASTSAHADVNQVHGDLISALVAAATIIHKGDLVAYNATGYLVKLTDTAGLVFAGQAQRTYDNSAGGDGDLTAEIMPPAELGRFCAKAASPTQAWVGQVATGLFDNEVSIPVTTANDIPVGQIIGVLDASADGQVLIEAARP